MLDIAEFLFPRDLQVSVTRFSRCLILGSCMAEDYVKEFRSTHPETKFDFVLFNNVADMPPAPPSPAAEYNFQFVQIPVRHLTAACVEARAKPIARPHRGRRANRTIT
jgi:hypothetical protein